MIVIFRQQAINY